MEKKFKNKLAVTGSKSLLKAFEEELLSLGYRMTPLFKTYDTSNCYLVNDWDGSTMISYCVEDHSKVKESIKLSLPESWNYALQLAAEIEEEVPEYVEWIQNIGSGGSGWMCGSLYFKKGKIFCTLTDDLPESGLHSDKSNWKKALTKEWYAVNFKESTKEAFEAQNKPKFKDGDWLYSKGSMSECLIKFKSLNSDNNVITDEYYQMFESGGFTSGSSDNYESIKNCQLATKEQIERILTKVAKSKYPVGCRIDQRTAYNGSGDKYVIENSNIDVYYDEYAKYWNVAIDRKGVYQTTFGKWAEIIPNEIKVKGYKIEKLSDTEIKIGCKVYTIMSLKRMFSLLREYGGAYYYQDIVWTADDIKQVIDTYDNV